MLRIHLDRELVSLRTERDVSERTVEFVNLTAHKQEVLAETEDHVLGKLLERLGLCLRDPLPVRREFALAPRLELGSKLIEHRTFDARYESAPFNILCLKLHEPLNQVTHTCLDPLPLSFEDVMDLGRGSILTFACIPLFVRLERRWLNRLHKPAQFAFGPGGLVASLTQPRLQRSYPLLCLADPPLPLVPLGLEPAAPP